MKEIQHNLEIVKGNIKKACKIYSKKPIDINLIAVSKTRLPNEIEEAIKSGCKDFGENRVEETKEKWPNLKLKYPDVKLHLIGHLQSKKVKNAVKIFDYIHSLDSLKLAEALKIEMEKQQKFPRIFLQVNIASEPAKTGLKLEDIDEFMDKMKNKLKLNIYGLMCIPPVNKEPTLYFSLLYKIAQKHNIGKLSMGMSSDYEKAIAINSNYIRVGEAIFGQRH